MNDTQKAIADYLNSQNINFAAKYLCETTRENNWQCDQWRVTLSKFGASFETDYFTGLGHRKVPGGYRLKKKHEIGYVAPKPVAPCAADVIYSLILDSGAADQSFNDWCADYGYDSDSISAFNTYQKCCDTAKNLRKVFSCQQIETLRNMLEDY